MLNIGWTVGPPLGTLLVMQSINLPFWLAAACSALPLVFIQTWVKRSPSNRRRFKRRCLVPFGTAARRALFWFTLSAFWHHSLAVPLHPVFRNTLWWSPMAILPRKWSAVVLPVNAAIVVSLQYALWSQAHRHEYPPVNDNGYSLLCRWPVGFAFSGNSLLLWGISAAFFTIGEVIYAPGEYMLIDNIAPAGMKASYFSAQSLGWLAQRLTH